jgi:hypothetical protein
MAIANRRHTDSKGDVKPCLANFANNISRSPLCDLQIDRWVQYTKLTQELGKKARRYGAVQTDTEPSLLTACYRARRPHGMIEMLNPGGHVFKEMPSGLSQPDAAVTSLEQRNTKILFELFNPRADGGLTNPQRGRGMTKIQMLGHRQCLNQRHERNAASQC